jgi:hypothetical protein
MLMLRFAPIYLIMASLWGAVVPRLDFPQIVEQSERIVHAEILGSEVTQSGNYLWTHYRVRVLDGIKGNPPTEITVSEPGGELNGIGMAVEGAVEYRAGEEVVLFLYRTPIGFWRASGYWQGKFDVVESAGVKTVRANLDQVTLVDSGQDAGPAAGSRRALASFDGMTLDQFKAEIRQEVAR